LIALAECIGLPAEDCLPTVERLLQEGLLERIH
jgi:DNA-binding Lrp family transcriptional regulator